MPIIYLTDYIQYHVYLVSNIKMIKADSKQQNPKKKAGLDTADETAQVGANWRQRRKLRAFLKNMLMKTKLISI